MQSMLVLGIGVTLGICAADEVRHDQLCCCGVYTTAFYYYLSAYYERVRGLGNERATNERPCKNENANKQIFTKSSIYFNH